MVAFNKFEVFTEDLVDGVHLMDAANHQLECYLSNATPSASLDAVKADLAEITIENGYTGPEDTAQTVSRAAGVTSVVGVDIVITATGSVGPFRYVVLQNTTPTSPLDPLISWWDYGSSISLASGETFTIDFGTSMFTVT